MLALVLVVSGCSAEADPLPSAADRPPDAPSADVGAAPFDEPTDGPDGGAVPEPGPEVSPPDTPEVDGPCPASAPCRILAMGDSITFGMRQTPAGAVSSGGYRRYLRRALLDAHKSFEYVGTCPGVAGRCRTPPDGNPPYCFPGGAPELGRHDGHPGFDINAFRARMPSAESIACPGSLDTFLSHVLDDEDKHVEPHIVLLMIGANDVREAAGIREGAAERFGYLLDGLLARLPTARIVVGTVTPNLISTNERDGVIPFNRAIRSLVAARHEAGRNVAIVDTHGAITIDARGESPDLSDDRLHPNESGYEKIAGRWFEAIAPLLLDR